MITRFARLTNSYRFDKIGFQYDKNKNKERR